MVGIIGGQVGVVGIIGEGGASRRGWYYGGQVGVVGIIGGK